MSQSSPLPRRTSRPRARAFGTAVVGGVALVMMGAIAVPGLVGTLAAVALPWLWLPALLVIAGGFAWWRRRWIALVPTLVWLVATASSLTWVPVPPMSGEGTLIVASQNVEAGSGTAGESALALAAGGAAVIALTELDAQSRDEAARALENAYPHHYLVGTVGIWSVYPIIDAEPLELGLGWRRALHAELDTPVGDVSVYVVHAASFRPGAQSERDTMLASLGEIITDDEHDRIIALGDFNAATTDPALNVIKARLSEPRQADVGFGFTWPVGMPATRIDHVFQRGFDAGGAEAVRAGDSDHLAVRVGLRPQD